MDSDLCRIINLGSGFKIAPSSLQPLVNGKDVCLSWLKRHIRWNWTRIEINKVSSSVPQIKCYWMIVVTLYVRKAQP